MRGDAKEGVSKAMLKTLPLCAALGSAAALVLALGGQQRGWRDRSGNMSILNISSARAEESPPDSGRFVFKFLGTPLVAEWKKQMLRLESNSLEGTASATSPGEISLITAKLSGSVSVVRKSRSAGSPTALQELKVASREAEYLASEERWAFTGGVALKRDDPAAGQSFMLNGTSATAFLYPPGAASAPRGLGVKSATVEGPVTFSLATTRTVKSASEPPKTEQRVFTTKGRCDKVEFDNETGKLTLVGNVHLEGDDPALLGGELDATRAVVTLDDAGRIRMIEAWGDPGVSRVKRPPESSGKPSREGARAQ